MIRSIIFDLGNVLVNVDYSSFRKKLEQSGVKEDVYNTFFTTENYRGLGYEAGKISTNEFVDKCLNGLGLIITPGEFIDAFNNVFSEIVPMQNLLKVLKTENKYNLYLLSNTSPLHFEFIQKRFDYVNLLDKFALSYKLKSLKPQDIIYHQAIELFNVHPAECAFIDDLEENCESARRNGIQAIQYNLLDHKKFETEFSEILTRE